MDELKEKIARAACSTALWPGSFEQETVGNKAYWRDVAQAALTALEEAGYVVFPKEDIEKMVREHDAERTDLTGRLFTALGASFVPSSPSHFDRADSATSFDPEKAHCKENDL